MHTNFHTGYWFSSQFSFPVLPGQLEVFHNALLKYCPKHIHFEYAAMQARTMLAIMDHNENHTTRQDQATTAAGKTYKYSKRQSAPITMLFLT